MAEAAKKEESSGEKVFRLLFICTGNTCRSPLAKVIAEKELLERGLSGKVEVMSAGLGALPNQPASSHALTVAEEMGLSLAEHRSALLTEEMIREADLILTMTGRHRLEVLSRVPEAAEKTYTLPAYAGAGADVIDPFGGSLEEYRRCANELRHLIARACDRLQQELTC